MLWDVEFTDEFEAWWNGLDEAEQVQLDARIGLLEQMGPQLGFPHSSGIMQREERPWLGSTRRCAES